MINQSHIVFSTDLDSEDTAFLKNLFKSSLKSAEDLITQFVDRSDFANKAELIFGENVDINKLEALWNNKDFTFPQIEIVPAETINGANGAFAVDTNTIYLAQEFLIRNANHLDVITNVLLEEYGHYLDNQLNNTDAPGDEGAIFAALVQGKELNEDKLQQLKVEDDSAVAVLDGQEVAIEQNVVSEDGRYGIDFDTSDSVTSARLLIRDFVTGETINTGINTDSTVGFINISADGQYVVFSSDKNLLTGGSSLSDSLYTYNRETGELNRFKPSLYDYVIGADHGSVSADGKFAIFGEKFGRDILVNTSTGEYEVLDNVHFSEISADGGYLTYENDSGIYIYNVETKESEKISQAGFRPKISGDGNYVLYYDLGDLYLYNRTTAETKQVNLNENGNEIDVKRGSYLHDISNNGRYISFLDENQYFVKDLTENTIKTFDIYSVLRTQDYIDISFGNDFKPFTDDGFVEIKNNGDLYVNFDNTNNEFNNFLYFGDDNYRKVDYDLPESELIPTVVNFRTSESRISENGAIITPLIIERTGGNQSEPIYLQLSDISNSGSADTFGNLADYDYFSEKIVIPAYQTLIEVDISSYIEDDDRYEEDESFDVKLEHDGFISSPNFAQIGDNNTATVVIEDNDNGISFYKIAEFLAKDAAYKDWSSIEGSDTTIEDVYVQLSDSGNFYKDVFNGESTDSYNLNYVVDKIFEGDNGFDAVGLKSNTGNAPILFLRGTETSGERLVDVFSDANIYGVGYNQFLKHKDEVSNWLDNVSAETGLAAEIIGHSLGGALAQWFAADYTGNQGKQLAGVTTFNSPAINTVPDLIGIGKELLFNRINPQPVRPLHGPSIFDPSKVSFVDHYITSGDIVSLAGEDFILGNYHLYDTQGGDLFEFENHLAPVLVSRLSDSTFNLFSDDSRAQLDNTRRTEFGTSDIISQESFGYPEDPDYPNWLQVSFPDRGTVESARRDEGTFLAAAIKGADGGVQAGTNLVKGYTDTIDSLGRVISDPILRLLNNQIETNSGGSPLVFAVDNASPSFDFSEAATTAQKYLKDFSQETNAIDRLMLAYGNDYDLDVAQSLIDAWGNNDFSSIPEIQIVPTSEIADSNGAYRASTSDIYLAQEFVAQNQDNPEAFAAVLLEEIGHHVDTLIKDNDSLGDEGEIFSALVREEQLTNEEYISLLNENDVKTMPVDETILEVISQWDDLAWEMSEEWDESAIEAVSQWTDEDWQQTLEWTDEQWQKSTLFTEEQWQETITNLPSLSISDITVMEGIGKNSMLTFAISLSKASAEEISIDYSTANNGAIAGQDYTAKSGTLTFAPGETEKTISVEIFNDNDFEMEEAFEVNLSNAVNAEILDNQGMGIIQNELVDTLELDLNGSTIGNLENTDDFYTHNGKNYYYDFHAVPYDNLMNSGDTVKITVSSDDFDPMLMILDGEGNVVEVNNNASAGSTTAELSYEVGNEPFFVSVENMSANTFGEYQLNAEII